MTPRSGRNSGSHTPVQADDLPKQVQEEDYSLAPTRVDARYTRSTQRWKAQAHVKYYCLHLRNHGPERLEMEADITGLDWTTKAQAWGLEAPLGTDREG